MFYPLRRVISKCTLSALVLHIRLYCGWLPEHIFCDERDHAGVHHGAIVLKEIHQSVKGTVSRFSRSETYDNILDIRYPSNNKWNKTRMTLIIPLLLQLLLSFLYFYSFLFFEN